MSWFSKAEVEVEADFGELEHLLYTPVVNHPILEQLREALVAQLNAHLSQVQASLLDAGNAVLKQMEASLPPAGK